MGFGQKPKQAAKVWSVAKRKLKTKDNCLTEMMMVLNCWAAKDGRCLQETKNLRDCVKAKVRRPARGFGGKGGKRGRLLVGAPLRGARSGIAAARRAFGAKRAAARPIFARKLTSRCFATCPGQGQVVHACRAQLAAAPVPGVWRREAQGAADANKSPRGALIKQRATYFPRSEGRPSLFSPS